MKSEPKGPDLVVADFELFFMKNLATEAQVKKLMKGEKIFTKIKYSPGLDCSLGRSFANFVVASERLQFLTGNFCYEIEKRPAGYLPEMRQRDFQSKMESLFVKTDMKFYFRVTSNNDRLIPMNLCPDQMIAVTGFSFGSLIEMHTFVDHVDFGKYFDKKTGMKTSMFKSDLFVRFLNGKNKVNINFKLFSPGGYKGSGPGYQQHYKFSLDYEGINFVTVAPGHEKDSDGRSVRYLDVFICYLKSPLLYFCAITDRDNTKLERYRNHYKSDEVDERVGKWMRCMSIPGVESDTFGRSSVIRLRLPSVKEYHYEKVKDGLQTDPLDILSCLSYFAACPIYWSKVDTMTAQSPFDVEKLSNELKKLSRPQTSGDEQKKSKPFVDYALQGIFSLSHYVSDFLNMTPDGEKPGDRKKKFAKMIRTYAFKHPKALEESLYDCFRLLLRTSALDVLQFLPERFERLTGDNQESRTRLSNPIENIKMVRRVFITPSRVICAPPEPTLASWFLNTLQDDCLIRVYFRDENMQPYTYTCNTHKRNRGFLVGKPAWKSMLEKRIVVPVVDGLPLSSKKFEFLVCSASMMRSHALLMYAEDDDGHDAAYHQKEIGDVKEKNKSVAKYIARSGQAVSQAIGRITVEPSRVVFDYPDVVNYDMDTRLKMYTFTDGIGMISSENAWQVAKKMKWKMKPSAFQIRYGGAKGVVAVNPDLPDMNGKHLFLRESMVKFASQSDSLEILKPSLLRPVHLNKSFIMVLDQLGVPEDVFVKLLLNELNAACSSFLSESEAMKTLKTYSALHVPLRIKKILDGESSINILREPFFRKCMSVVTKEMVHQLKSKARIKIPMDVGRHMLGVTDETGQLEEGEVFVQYTNYTSYFSNDPQDIKCEILEGDVLVTKAPTMVVGDVRKLKARNIPALHHHRDVIVFSQKGLRPDPDKMAGSDLDGDEYVVIWFKPLFFKGFNREPLDYRNNKKAEEKEITTESIMDCFLQYIERDSVGLIATTHLARSDRDRDGSDPINSNLALKYTRSLDAPKTGDYQRLEQHEMSNIHPDYMGKEAHGPSYVSERILGTIYRQVCFYEMAVCDYVTVQPLKQANQLLVHKDWEKYKSSAEASLRKYSAMIHSLLKQYHVDDEASLLTQSFAGQSNGRELRDFRKTIDVQVKEITSAMREDFEKEFADVPEGTLDQKMEKDSMKQAKASAWYMVTQEASLRDTDSPMLALPWIVGNYLADLSNEDASLPRSNPVSIIQEMSEQLDDKIKENNKLINELSFEERFEEATEILTKWMEYQGHLTFLTAKQVNESLAELHSVLCDIRRGYEVNPELELPSIGYLVILTMIQMAKIVLERTSVTGFSHDTYEIESNLNFAFLSSLVKLFRSGDPDHILTDRFPMPKATASFYLGIESKYTDSFEKFNMYKYDFQKLLKRLTGIDEVESSFEYDGRKVRINAYGYKWNLIQLRMILSQDKFLAHLLDLLDGRFQRMRMESEKS